MVTEARLRSSNSKNGTCKPTDTTVSKRTHVGQFIYSNQTPPRQSSTGSVGAGRGPAPVQHVSTAAAVADRAHLVRRAAYVAPHHDQRPDYSRVVLLRCHSGCRRLSDDSYDVTYFHPAGSLSPSHMSRYPHHATIISPSPAA